MTDRIKVHHGASGRYKLRAGKYDGNGEFMARAETGWFDNLITDYGLDRMGVDATQFQWCYVGSGSTQPSVTDADLEQRITQRSGTVSASDGVNGEAPHYVWSRRVYEFPDGAAAGNISEVGTGWEASPTDGIFSRALVLDSEGNPTTITVLSNETLQVTFEHRVYPALVDATGFVTLDGVDYAYTMRPFRVHHRNTSSAWSMGGLGTIASELGPSSPNGQLSDSNVLVDYTDFTFPGTTVGLDQHAASGSYVSGSYQRDVIIGVGPDKANFTEGVGSAWFRFGWGTYFVRFDPKIPKTDQNTLELVLRHSWGRK